MIMNKIKFNITLTWSKIMALLVLIAGTIISIRSNDTAVFMTTIGAITLILGIKQVVDTKTPKE